MGSYMNYQQSAPPTIRPLAYQRRREKEEGVRRLQLWCGGDVHNAGSVFLWAFSPLVDTTVFSHVHKFFSALTDQATARMVPNFLASAQ